MFSIVTKPCLLNFLWKISFVNGILAEDIYLFFAQIFSLSLKHVLIVNLEYFVGQVVAKV